jgi:hypothetical protein
VSAAVGVGDRFGHLASARPCDRLALVLSRPDGTTLRSRISPNSELSETRDYALQVCGCPVLGPCFDVDAGTFR